MNIRTRQRKLAEINKAINDQLKWMDQCGRDRAGYIAKYSGHYDRAEGDAEAIYEADKAELDRLVAAEWELANSR